MNSTTKYAIDIKIAVRKDRSWDTQGDAEIEATVSSKHYIPDVSEAIRNLILSAFADHEAKESMKNIIDTPEETE